MRLWAIVTASLLRVSLGAVSRRCPAGFFCPPGGALPTVCPPGSLCPAGSESPEECPAGLYCPVPAASEGPCPPSDPCVPFSVEANLSGVRTDVSLGSVPWGWRVHSATPPLGDIALGECMLVGFQESLSSSKLKLAAFGESRLQGDAPTCKLAAAPDSVFAYIAGSHAADVARDECEKVAGFGRCTRARCEHVGIYYPISARSQDGFQREGPCEWLRQLDAEAVRELNACIMTACRDDVFTRYPLADYADIVHMIFEQESFCRLSGQPHQALDRLHIESDHLLERWLETASWQRLTMSGPCTYRRGSAEAVPCPAGSFCPTGSSAPLPCPAGHVCPASSSLPSPCESGRKRFCPAGSSMPTWCPVGHVCSSRSAPQLLSASASNDSCDSSCSDVTISSSEAFVVQL